MTPKKLPINQVSEILHELNNLETMARELGHDAERGSQELAANSNDQFLRRNLVRIFTAFVEGYSFTLKQVVLRLHEPLQEQLSNEELSKLKELVLDVTGKPILDEQGLTKNRFLRFQDNFKFARTMFLRLSGANYILSHGSVGYQSFRKIILVRDRLMHPKTMQDLFVTDSETIDLQIAWQWHQTEMVDLMKAATNGINLRFSTIFQSRKKQEPE